jgi:hypothetical protein
MALFTVTSDSTLRIYMPVIDSPQRLQLHASLDLYSCLPYPVISSLIPAGQEQSPPSSIVWLDHQATHAVIKKLLEGSTDQEATEFKRLQQLREGDWDLFLRVLPDGSLALTSVAVSDVDKCCTVTPNFLCSEYRSTTSIPDPELYRRSFAPATTTLCRSRSRHGAHTRHCDRIRLPLASAYFSSHQLPHRSPLLTEGWSRRCYCSQSL